MHTGTLKKWALALTFWLALHLASLKAQTIPFQLTAGSGGTAVDFEWRLDGSIIEEGSGSSTLSNADLESGSRFIWYPALSALRAGYNSTETVSEVGQYSVAMGYQAIASGEYSVALGEDATAGGEWSTAIGAFPTASGEFSMSLGTFTTASGPNAMALGDNTYATGTGSTAMGQDTTASGNYSTALDFVTVASGNFSTASGFSAVASGSASTALGYQTSASAAYSVATGFHTQAQSYNSFTIGTYNVGGGTAGYWVATDPLFEIGNGTSSGATSDALVVYKNGAITAQGPITAQSGVLTTAASVSTTDIPMYSGD